MQATQDEINPSTLDPREKRWAQERVFFDQFAALRQVRATPPVVLQRYQEAKTCNTFLEFCFQVLGNVKNKHILDLTCGQGQSSVLLAQLGAYVTGVDLSPISLEMAKQRAQLDKVDGRTRFLLGPIETMRFPENTFDVIWCEASLHHLTAELPLILENIRCWTKPDGLIIIAEPIAHISWLRTLRHHIPVALNGTPDERPLTRAETRLIEQSLVSPHSRYFRLINRIERLLFDRECREYGPSWRRHLETTALWLDRILTKLPGSKHLSSIVVIYGRPLKSSIRTGPAWNLNQYRLKAGRFGRD